jgi:hypothetical protein
VQVRPLRRRGTTVELEQLPNMKPYLMTLAAFLFISSLLLVPDVYAQFSGGGMGGGPGAGMGGGRPGDRGKGCDGGEKPGADKGPKGQPPEMMGREQLEYKLSTLQVDLRLTPEQTTLWHAYANHILALESDLSRQRARGVSASATLGSGPAGAGVRQIASAVDSARNRLAALEDIETANRALYKVLQPEQTTMADVRSAEYLTPLLRR